MENTGFTATQQMPVPVVNRGIPTVPCVNTCMTGPISLPAQALMVNTYPYMPTSYVIRYCIPTYSTTYTSLQTKGIPQQQVVNLPSGTNYIPISGYNVNINSINTSSGSAVPISASQPLPTATASAAATATATASAPPPPLQPSPQPAESPPVPDKVAKAVTPLTPELINKLNTALSRGNKDERLKAVGTTLKLLREDPEERKNNPALIGLINKSLNQVQPSEVKTAAIIACEDGLVGNNPRTQQLLQALSLNPDGMENHTMASTALNNMQSAV